MSRLKEAYKEIISVELMKKLGLKNVHQIPKLDKIVINMGVSDARENPKAMDVASSEIAGISGQKPLLCRAKKSISAFKLREGMPIGLKVTLRGDRMYEFFDRLLSVALPRIRDFKGFPHSSFDESANYSLGLSEQTIFAEVEVDKVVRTQGMDITIVTNSKSKEAVLELLKFFGFPFRRA